MKPRWVLVVASGAALALVIGVTFLRADDPAPWVVVGSVEGVRQQRVVYLTPQEVFVVAADDSFVAFSAAAQHIEGERVLYCSSSGWFVGPHGEGFDQLGNYVFGPAQSGLSPVDVRVVDGEVQVNPTVLRTPPPRGAGKPHEPSGPFCIDDGTGHAEVEPGFTS